MSIQGYNVGYGASGLTNPVPVVSLTANNEAKSFTLDRSSDGIAVQVWKQQDGNWQKANGAFDFIVAEIA